MPGVSAREDGWARSAARAASRRRGACSRSARHHRGAEEPPRSALSIEQEEDAQQLQYYRIWWPLLAYVNEQRRLVPRVIGITIKAGALSTQEAAAIRDALWADDALREAFIAEYPAHLSPEDLEIAASWRYRVAGRFFVLRYLKRHAIFLGGSKPA